MKDFTHLADLSPKHAKILRDEMEARGWLKVRDAERPKTTDLEIDTTTEGRRIGEASLAMAEADERAARKRGEKR